MFLRWPKIIELEWWCPFKCCLVSRFLILHIFVITIITVIYCPLWKYSVQKKHIVMGDQRVWLWTATLNWNVGLAEAQHHHTSFMSSSPSTRILRYLLEYSMPCNWKKALNKNFRYGYFCQSSQNICDMPSKTKVIWQVYIQGFSYSDRLK